MPPPPLIGQGNALRRVLQFLSLLVEPEHRVRSRQNVQWVWCIHAASIGLVALDLAQLNVVATGSALFESGRVHVDKG